MGAIFSSAGSATSDRLSSDVDDTTGAAPDRLSSNVDETSERYEVEISPENDEHCTTWDSCKKNPGHIQFIPVRKFRTTSLPGPYRHVDVHEFIMAVAALTVRVQVGNDEEQLRTESHVTRGTGWIMDVFEKSTDKDGKSCPCSICFNSISSMAQSQWGYIKILTANHVLEKHEVAVPKICCDLFYDTHDKAGIKTLFDVEAINSDGNDRCELGLVTHDMDLIKLLKELCQRRRDLWRKIDEEYPSSDKDETNLVVIVSHPHGREKNISVGMWVEREVVDYIYSRYRYTTATCPGSSGAPIIIPRRWGDLSFDHFHASAYDDTYNQSGPGWDPS